MTPITDELPEVKKYVYVVLEPTSRFTKAGTGTLDMIERCREMGLPGPDFEQRADQFVVTLWRDWLTDAVLGEMELNERQKQAIRYLKATQLMTNLDYQRITGCPPRTATRDLNFLVGKGLVEPQGKGRGAHYLLVRKRAKKTPNVPTKER